MCPFPQEERTARDKRVRKVGSRQETQIDRKPLRGSPHPTVGGTWSLGKVSWIPAKYSHTLTCKGDGRS